MQIKYKVPPAMGKSELYGRFHTLIIPYKKLHPDAVAPKQGTAGSAGFDLTAISKEFDPKSGTWIYGTGLAFEIPEGHVGYIFPRSSIYKTGCRLANCTGVIDSDYRGEVRFMFDYRGWTEGYEVGDRIGQLVIMPVPTVEFEEAEELSETERGTGGYGSTGR